FLPGLGVNLDRDLISHGAAGNENRGFALENLRRALLQAVDCGVFAVNVVAYLGLSHGAAHVGGGTRDRVAAQINRGLLRSGAHKFEAESVKNFTGKTKVGHPDLHSPAVREQLKHRTKEHSTSAIVISVSPCL